MLRTSFVPISTGGRTFANNATASEISLNVEFDGTLEVPAVVQSNFPGKFVGRGYPGGMLLTLTLNFDAPKNAAEAPEYKFAIAAGGQTDTLTVAIMYTEQYNRNMWRVTRELSQDQPYAMSEIDRGAQFLMSEITTRFAMLLQYATVLRYHINDIRWRLNTRKKLSDLLAAGISGIFADAQVVSEAVDEAGRPTITRYVDQDANSVIVEKTYVEVEKTYDYSGCEEYKTLSKIKVKDKIVFSVKVWKADQSGALWYPICNAEYSLVDQTLTLSNGVKVTGKGSIGYKMKV